MIDRAEPAKQLHAAIDDLDTDGIVALLAPLSEAERAALNPGVVELVDELYHRWQAYEPGPGRSSPEALRDHRRREPANLAWLGTGDPDSFPPVKDIEEDQDAWYRRSQLEHACATPAGHRILRDRRPPWLDRLAGEYLDYGHWLWDPFWRLVVDGLVDRPRSARYLTGLGGYAGKSGSEPLEDMVRRDPALLKVDLPALLALPDGLAVLVRGDERTVGRHPDHRRIRVWSPLLGTVLPVGDPLRDRIINGVLDTLGGDVGRDAAMYRQFLTALRPTVAELADRRRRLLRLAGHHVPSVVTFAVQALVKIDRTAGLDPADVVDRLSAAAGADSVATARAAVKLIGSAVRRQPEVVAGAAEALAPALTHTSPEVQLDAVRLLLPHAAGAEVRAALAAAAPDLAPTVAAELGDDLLAGPADPAPDLPALLTAATRLLEAAGLSVPTGPATPGRGSAAGWTDPAVGLAGTGEADAGFPGEAADAVISPGAEPASALMDLHAAVVAAGAGAEPPPVSIRPWRDARPTAPPVTPIDTIDDLIESLLRVIDRSNSMTTTMERALDGLAAIGSQWPEDIGRRVGPLLARVNHIFSTDEPDWGDGISGDFCYLVANWMEPDRVIAGKGELATPRDWLVGRIREVALLLQRRCRTRLLALPTDEADWIDPGVLAERVLAIGDAALRQPLDTAIAVARLAPWGRRAALDRLTGAAGTLAAVVRAACGSGEDVSAAPDPVRRAVAWQLGHPHAGPAYLFGAPAPAPPEEYDRLDIAELYDRAEHRTMPDGGIYLDMTHLAEYQAWERWHAYLRVARYATGWAASQWPGDDRWVWAGEPHSRMALRWLLDPDEPLPPEALTVLVRRLVEDSPERRALATDILTQAITDGRITSRELGAALAIHPDPWHSRAAGRMVEALTLTAPVSPLHRAVVRRSLATSATAWHTVPARPLCALLTLLDQLCTTDGFGLAVPEARTALQPLATGRTKSAALIRRVLAHPTTGTDWPAAAAAATLTGRLDRARRLADAPQAEVTTRV